MLEKILDGVVRLEELQRQGWGMMINRKSLLPTKTKPQISLDHNLLSVTKAKGETLVEFNPSLQGPDRWKLVSIDGHEPTSRELRAHKQRYSGRSQKLPMERIPPVGDMVPKSSLSIIDEALKNHVLAQFTPHLKLPVIGDIAKQLVGRGWFNKEGGFIEKVVVQNERKISPVPGLSIDQFHLGMRFGLVTLDGKEEPLVVMKESELLVVGKKLFKSIDQISHYQYSDHWLP